MNKRMSKTITSHRQTPTDLKRASVLSAIENGTEDDFTGEFDTREAFLEHNKFVVRQMASRNVEFIVELRTKFRFLRLNNHRTCIKGYYFSKSGQLVLF